MTVTVCHSDQGFSIEDTGPGSSFDEGEQMFENGYSTSEEGGGYGLAIVEHIAEAHGWQFQVTPGEQRGARLELRSVEFAHEE